MSGSVIEIKFEFINFLSIGRWNFGREIGRPESSLIQTADCPQVGGQMVHMAQTKHSPVYGITDWQTCANICQGLSKCNYWQWDEKNAACHSVVMFAGFNAAAGFVTGAQNCPISTNSLVTLCPSRGSNSLMWRDANQQNNAFFIPGSSLTKGKIEIF